VTSPCFKSDAILAKRSVPPKIFFDAIDRPCPVTTIDNLLEEQLLPNYDQAGYSGRGDPDPERNREDVEPTNAIVVEAYNFAFGGAGGSVLGPLPLHARALDLGPWMFSISLPRG
jgi:hypothetical protein